MSMFHITGQVLNTYFQPGSTDPETGEKTQGKNKVQILGKIPVSNGESKMDIVTLSIPDGIDFEPHMQKHVNVPLGMFSPSKGNIIYFIPKGSEVVPVPPPLPQ